MLLVAMKTVILFALLTFVLLPPAFGQITSVKRIARQIKTPPSAEPTNTPARPAAPAARPGAPAPAPAASAPWYSPAPREKTKAEKDEALKKTIEFQKTQAEGGSASAQYDLGMRFLNGDGVERNEATAKKWFELAAKQDHTQARKQLELLNPAKPAK